MTNDVPNIIVTPTCPSSQTLVRFSWFIIFLSLSLALSCPLKIQRTWTICVTSEKKSLFSGFPTFCCSCLVPIDDAPHPHPHPWAAVAPSSSPHQEDQCNSRLGLRSLRPSFPLPTYINSVNPGRKFNFHEPQLSSCIKWQ